jgi:hypothetical protein
VVQDKTKERKKMVANIVADGRVAGTIRFDSNVRIEDLVRICSKLKSRHSDRWVDLHIRTLPNQENYLLVFHYKIPDTTERTRRKVMKSFIDFLSKQLVAYNKNTSNNDDLPPGVLSIEYSVVRVIF